MSNITDTGFDFSLTADSPVWTGGGASPAYSIAYKAVCENQVSVPLIGYSGVTNVTYINDGSAHSQITHITFPAACQNPAVTTQSYADSAQCAVMDGSDIVGGVCINNPSSTSTDVHSYIGTVTPSGFDVILSADDAIWPGASGTSVHPVAWHVTCDTVSTPPPVIVPTVCVSLCGDNMRVGYEECDDGNTLNGDGCSSSCITEDGWMCIPPVPFNGSSSSSS